LPDFIEISQTDAFWIPGGRGVVKTHFRSNPRWRTNGYIYIAITPPRIVQFRSKFVHAALDHVTADILKRWKSKGQRARSQCDVF